MRLFKPNEVAQTGNKKGSLGINCGNKKAIALRLFFPAIIAV